MKDALTTTCRGFVHLALEGYSCDEFRYWLRRVFYRAARCWENVIALLEDGPCGLLTSMLQHRNEAWQQREHARQAEEFERAKREYLAQAA